LPIISQLALHIYFYRRHIKTKKGGRRRGVPTLIEQHIIETSHKNIFIGECGGGFIPREKASIAN